MKRIIALVLLCVMLFAGCGQQAAPAPENTEFSVGFAKKDITPETSVPMDGYDGANAPAKRWSNSTELPLEANCVAISDTAGTTVLLITADLLHAYNELADAVRSEITAQTGLPKENVFFHCTHNHSGPALRGVASQEITEYLAQLIDDMVLVSKEALADRKAAEMYTTFTRPEHCSFVRHYLLSDGTFLSSPGSSLPVGVTYYGQATRPDDLMQLVKFTREGGKDVMLVNWQGHPCAAVEKTVLNSDYPGALRKYLAENLDCDALVIQGGGGNMVTTTLLPNVEQYKDYKQYAEALGKAAAEAAASFVANETDRILVSEQILPMETKDGGLRKAPLGAFSIGDFALVSAPFEIFDTNAVAVKESSPYSMTFYASCTNGSNGYLPTEACFGWAQNYEARITQFSKGTADTIQNTQLSILNALFQKSGRTEAEKPEGYVLTEEDVYQTDGKTYTNPAVGQDFTLKPLENGFYTILLSDGFSHKTMIVKNKTVAEELVALETMQLLFDASNVIVGVVK